jgi:hypothetical protein
MVHPDIDYVVVESAGRRAARALRPRRGAARGVRPRAPGTTKGDVRDWSWRGSRARSCRALDYTPADDLLPGPRQRLPGRARRLRHHRPTAPGWSTPPVPSVRTTRSSPTARASRRRAGRHRRVFTLPGHRLRPGCMSSTPTPGHRPPQGAHPARRATAPNRRDRLGHRGHGPAPPRDLRPLLPALLALPQPLIYMAVSSAGSSTTTKIRDGCWSSTRRSPGCPSTSRTASSASGWRTPATGRSRETASGAARSRCGSPTTRSTRGSTSMARFEELERDFGVRPDRPAPARSSTS